LGPLNKKQELNRKPQLNRFDGGRDARLLGVPTPRLDHGAAGDLEPMSY
jgi:hypothetical protein